MKTIIKVVFAGIFVLAISSCSETDDRLDNRIETIYENKANEGVTNPSLLEDNLVSVERVGKDHRIFKEIAGEISASGILSDRLDMKSLKRFRYNYTLCNLYSIDHKDGCEKTILYEYDGQYLIAQAKLEQLNDKIRLFELHTTDGNICFSMELSSSNLIGDIRIEENRLLNAYRDKVSNQVQQERALKGTKASYCRQESSWGDCFTCSMNYCASKWYCAIAVAAYPIEFIAGFAASCIGANPGATP